MSQEKCLSQYINYIQIGLASQKRLIIYNRIRNYVRIWMNQFGENVACMLSLGRLNSGINIDYILTHFHDFLCLFSFLYVTKTLRDVKKVTIKYNVIGNLDFL